MDGTRLHFPASLIASCLHRRRDGQQGGVVSLLLGLFNFIHYVSIHHLPQAMVDRAREARDT